MIVLLCCPIFSHFDCQKLNLCLWYPLLSNHNDEAKACADLDKRGYKKVDKKAQAADNLVKKLRSTYSDCPVGVLQTTILR